MRRRDRNPKSRASPADGVSTRLQSTARRLSFITSMLEREIKLDAPPSFRLEAVTGLGGGYRLSKIETATFDSRYFDTADYRLTRAGCSLRHRTGRGWTLKLPHLSEQGEMARMELA